jgi:dipeptidyl aminopeptidase/acylaminoacyl peptidase
MFKRTAILILIVSLSLWACQKEEALEVTTYTIEQFMDTESIGGSSFSEDETTILYSSNRSGIYNAYTIPITGGEPTPLTLSEDNAIFAISFFPNDDRILYHSDKGGNEIAHIYLRNEDGTTVDLTPGENAKAQFYGWSFDEKSFFYSTNKRDPRFMDIYEMDIETLTPQMVFQDDEGYYLGSISNNKRYFVFTKPITEHNSNMYLFDRETNTMKHLTPHEGNVNFRPQTFSADSKDLYFLTDEDSEFTYLKKHDILTGQEEKVEEYNWDIMYSYFSRNDKYRIVGINEDGKTVIKVYDVKSGQPIPLPEFPKGEITSVKIAKSETFMVFYTSGSRLPNNLFVYDFQNQEDTQLTDTLNPEIDPEDLVEAEVVRYQSFDGLEIPAIFYKPHSIRPGEKLPALVKVHGGPGGQARVRYNPTIQYLVNHGYVIIDVNNRGSSGYGKSFIKMDDKKHGEVDLDDCVEAKKFLIATGYVDADKIGIWGGSYGGYMTLAALTFRPEAFAVGVDLFGISNWIRTLESIPPWWEAQKEALYEELGDPEKDREMLYAKSPLFHSENIIRPLMVLQGANDPRVIQAESDDIVAAVRKNGVPVEYVLFEDEGHGFDNRSNEIEAYKAILDFLDKYLKGTPTPQ